MKENRGARIRMDIELEGPVVIVPRNEQSEERLEADLGTLVVSNRFKYAKHLLEERNLPVDGISDNPDFPAVIDCMKVELQRLKVTRLVESDVLVWLLTILLALITDFQLYTLMI